MWEFETSVKKVIKRTPNIKTFRFATHGEQVSYEAGQYLYVNIRIGGREATHHFTISSSPTETLMSGYLEFTKKITTSDYSQALDKMEPGSWAKLRGPEGRFTLSRGGHKLAFLSGGIGITPLRSMLRYIADKQLDRDVVLIYGNDKWENIAFREELDDIAESFGKIRVEYVLSGPEVPAGWKGRRGYITRHIVTELVPDYTERTFYVSGPPKMVLGLEGQLSTIVDSDRIERDYFPGYD